MDLVESLVAKMPGGKRMGLLKLKMAERGGSSERGKTQ